MAAAVVAGGPSLPQAAQRSSRGEAPARTARIDRRSISRVPRPRSGVRFFHFPRRSPASILLKPLVDAALRGREENRSRRAAHNLAPYLESGHLPQAFDLAGGQKKQCPYYSRFVPYPARLSPDPSPAEPRGFVQPVFSVARAPRPGVPAARSEACRGTRATEKTLCTM